MAGIAAAVAVVFGLLLLVRISQGAPPEASWAELVDDSRRPALALAGPGDRLHVVEAGESYWSLAKEIAPGSDPRPVVDALRDANGGAMLRAGEPIVIPGSLLEGGWVPR